MYKEAFAKRLQYARKQTGLTQRDITKELGIAQSTIARYESGDREPDLETLGTLADFYEVSVDWLLGTKGVHNINKNKKMEIEYYRNSK